jgi:hypothetical protein
MLQNKKNERLQEETKKTLEGVLFGRILIFLKGTARELPYILLD